MYKIITTEEKLDNAQKMAMTLVESKIAYSVHITEVSSVYGWKDKVQTGKEYELNILTRKRDEVIKSIKELSEYESPEILIYDLEATPETVDWCTDWCRE